MKNKEDILWQGGDISIEQRNFFVSNDPNGIMGYLLDAVVEPQNIDKIEELFSPNGIGYFEEGEPIAVRLTKNTLHYVEWKNENPFDLEKEEIWLIEGSAERRLILRGDDLRGLLYEAKKIWPDYYDRYLEELRTWVWQKEGDTNVTIDKDGFRVVDDPDNVLSEFLLTFGDPEDKEEVDAMFAPDGEGYSDPVKSIHRHTYAEELPNFAWRDDNPWDLEKDEIWTIRYDFSDVQETIKGEDLRHLIEETRALWSEWEKFQNKQQKSWWNPF